MIYIARGLLALGMVFAPVVNATEAIDISEGTVMDLVDWASAHLGKSLIVGADLKSAPLSIYAKYDTPQQLEELVGQAVRTAGFYFSSDAKTIQVSSKEMPTPLSFKTEVIQLQNLQSDFAFESVRDVLNSRMAADQASSKGSMPGQAQAMVSPSPTSNALIVTATADQLDVVRQVVKEIDRPRRQVMITAVVAELSDDDFQSLGLNVTAANNRLSLSGTAFGKVDYSDLGFSLTFDGPTLGAFFQAVKSTGRSRILSTPQLLTLNREEASIVVGQNVPFITGSTTSGATPADNPYQTITRQDVGVTLKVKPFITPSGSIELTIEQDASSVSNDKTAADIITNTRRISTKVQLANGSGILLGGLRSEQTDKSTSRVPVLSDVPVLGRLFRFDSERTKASNLVVMLSARVFDPAKPLSDLSQAPFTSPQVAAQLALPVLSIGDSEAPGRAARGQRRAQHGDAP